MAALLDYPPLLLINLWRYNLEIISLFLFDFNNIPEVPATGLASGFEDNSAWTRQNPVHRNDCLVATCDYQPPAGAATQQGVSWERGARAHASETGFAGTAIAGPAGTVSFFAAVRRS